MGEKRQLFLIEFELTNVEEIKEIENYLLNTTVGIGAGKMHRSLL